MSTSMITEQQKEIAIKCVAGIATIAFCYSMMINTAIRDMVALIANIQNSKQRIELYQDVRSLQKSLKEDESHLPTITERSQLLGKISDVASQQKIRVQTLTPKTETSGGYVNLRVEMDGQGSFLTLIKFLQAMEKMGDAIRVKDVTALLKPSENPREKQFPLQLQITFETLLKQRMKKT